MPPITAMRRWISIIAIIENDMFEILDKYCHTGHFEFHADENLKNKTKRHVVLLINESKKIFLILLKMYALLSLNTMILYEIKLKKT